MARRHKDLEFDNEDQLRQLFSEIDEVKASDELKSSTLDFVLRAQVTEPDEDSGEVREDESAEQNLESKTIDFAAARDSTANTTAHGKRGRRSRKMRLRALFLAACLAAFGVGGIAYASPVSHVSVGYGGKVVTVDINIFGRTVSVYGDSTKSVRGIANFELANRDYRESVQEVVGALVEEMPERKSKKVEVEIKVESIFDSSRNSLQEGVENVLADNNEKDSKNVVVPYFVDPSQDNQEATSESDEEQESDEDQNSSDDTDGSEEDSESESPEKGSEETEGNEPSETEIPVVPQATDRDAAEMQPDGPQDDSTTANPNSAEDNRTA